MYSASVLRALLALVLSVSALPAAAQVNYLFDPTAPISVVYRVHAVEPLIVFAAGISARGNSENLLTVASGACTSPTQNLNTGWVGMTTDRDQATQFAHRYLASASGHGSSRRQLYIYAIRADATFISVPGAFYSAIDAASGSRAGYSANHARALRSMLHARPILGEQAVVAAHVRPTSFINGTPVWLENGAVVEGITTPNDQFIDDGFESATTVVPDNRLWSLLPPNRVLAAVGPDPGTCAMTCDGATSASSFSVVDDMDYAAICSVSDAMSPMLFDIIND